MGKSRTEGATWTGSEKRRGGKTLASGVSAQAQKVYDWEAEWYHWNTQQFQTIYGPRRWVHYALDLYGVPRTVVRHRSGRESSFFRPHDWSINILVKHRNVAAALHEAAHAIHAYYYGNVEEHHDERWLGIYVWLLNHTQMYPKGVIDTSLKNAGIKYSRMMTPKVLKHKKPALAA